MEASGVVPGAPRPVPTIGDSRFGEAFAPPPQPPPTPPVPPPELGSLDKIRSALGVAVPPPQSAAAGPQPQGGLSIGNMVGGYRYKGGDPNNPRSWEKAQ